MAIVGILAVVAVALALLVPWVERHFLSTGASPVEVMVLRAHGGAAQDEAPSDFVYAVRLPEGGEALLNSRRIHRPGDQATVFRSRGRISGRVILTEPDQIVSPGQ